MTQAQVTTIVDPTAPPPSEAGRSPKVVVVGAGWAGLGATYHLARQGYDVTLLEAGSHPGGLVAGWQTPGGRAVEAGIHGFWYPYRNIFSLVDELELQPFTPFTRSCQYSPAGLEVESPIFQDMPPLPTPLGTFVYTRFQRLPLSDRLSALPLLYSVIDFDNSDDAWNRYDPVTARELFKTFGVSQRLYKEAFEPMLLVGLFAPGEQCSAAATLGMLYYFILAHQPDFDVVWCRGTVGEQIFRPWTQRIERLGGKILPHRRVTDVELSDDHRVSAVICQHDQAEERYDADAVIFSVGISGIKKIVAGSTTLSRRSEFCNLRNLGGIDVLALRLWFDRRVAMPRPSNACFGFDATTGWTFFDLTVLHDEYRNEPGSVVEVDFYHANQLLPMADEDLVAIAQQRLSRCIPAFREANVIDQSVIRIAEGVSHFAPGSYQYMLPRQTSLSNVFMSGDWVVTRHGSWSQEKAYVTGIEAANAVMQHCGQGTPAPVIPVEPDEPHIRLARALNHNLRQWANAVLPWPFLP